ncbi:putative diguanylate cyclase YegE [bacterium HR40]|nr:putative diguanylate cyclase YegE [bacterium HR40]
MSGPHPSPPSEPSESPAAVLARRIRQLELAGRIAGIGFWDYDFTTGRFWWSEEIWRIAGLEPDAFRLDAESRLAIFHPEDREARRRAWAEAIAAKRDFDHRARVIRPDGSIRHVETRGLCRLDERGEVAGYFGILQDITERIENERRLEEAIRQAEADRALLQTATEVLFDGFALFDPEDRLVLCNRAFAALYGEEPEALAGRSFEELQRLPAFRHRFGLAHLDETAFARWLAERLQRHREASGIPREVRGGDLCFWVQERRLRDGSIVLCRTDITALKRTEENLRSLAQAFARARHAAEAAHALLRAATDVLSDGFALFGPDDRLRLCNHAFAALEGTTPQALEGRCFAELARSHLDRHRPGLDPEARARELAARLALHARADGTPFDLAVGERHYVVREHRLPDGHTVLLQTEVTHLKQIERDLRRLATIDELTELANRRQFFDRGRRLLERARRHDQRVALLLFDLDHFKQINDSHGHAAGDLVLRRVADICRSTLRSHDLVARLGGEEFAVLLIDTDREEALAVAERLRTAIATADIRYGEHRLAVTISVGIAVPEAGREDLEACLAAADRALYRAKHEGRNRVCAVVHEGSAGGGSGPSRHERRR